MKNGTRLEIGRGLLVAAPAPSFRALLGMLLAVWLCSPVAIGQCNTVLQSGGPIATLRGRVRASVLWDPDGAGPLSQWLVVGGEHLTGGDQLDPVGLLAYDGAQWRGLGFDVDELVLALTVFNGELIAGGTFTLTTATGVANRIARRSGSSWQPLVSGMDSAVHALTTFAGNLIAGGSFTTAGGSAIAKIAQWNGTSWSSLGASPFAAPSAGGYVHCLATFGSLYVGGFYQTPAGHGLLRWNGTTWSAAGQPHTGISIGEVTALSPFTGTTQGSSFLVAGGDFVNIGGIPAASVARAGTGVTSWTAMGSGLPQLRVKGLFARAPFLGTPEVIATGELTDSTARVRLWTGTAWSTLGSFGPSTGTAAATAPRFFGGYVVGLDDAAAAPRAPAMFRFANDWLPLAGKGIPSPVQCLAFDGPDAIAGGAFATVDGVTVNGIARRTGTTWSALGSGVAGGSATVNAVVRAANGDVFAGGSFTSAGGNAASNVARWNGTAWAPLGTGTNNQVLALRIASNGDLIAGGDFTTAGGVICNRIARWNGTAWSPLASGMNGTVRCLAELDGGAIVAGGSFTVAGGVACSRVAMWSGLSWFSMNLGMNTDVLALTTRTNGELVAGGSFTTVGGGFPCAHLARWTGTQWLSLSFGVPDTVTALTPLPDGDVLIGGRFATAPMNHLARYDSAINQIQGVGSGVSGPEVFALAAAPNGDVFVGGDFDAILPSTASGNLAILTTNCPALATSAPTTCVGPAGAVNLVADTLPWLGSTFRSTATGFAPTSIAIAVLGFTPVNLPLTAVLPVGLPNCDLRAAPDVLTLSIPVAGSAHDQFVLSSSPAFAGVPLFHQFVQLQLAPSGAMQSLSSSNALTLVPGLL